MFQDITIDELLELRKSKELQLVDVRSQGEFAEATIPGSLNIPFFNDEERSEIGTIYKQVSVQAAKERGLEIVSAKLPSLVKQFEQIPQRKAVFCWRGGMRSKTTATVLSLMGIHSYRLVGGFRAYRKWVVDTLEHFDFQPECVVLNGNTGTGKTKILQLLAAQGYPVIDLEEMAQHRGSIFGQIGLHPNNQKCFDSLLLEQLLQVNDKPYVLIEAESKRVGKAVLPEFLVEAKERGRQIYIEMPTEVRVRHIIEDYQPQLHKEECLRAFELIEKRIHTPISRTIGEALQQSRFEEGVALLLEHYYDPRYEYALHKYDEPPYVCRASSVEEAADMIIRRLDVLYGAGIFLPGSVSK